jgi:hypothetical protein
MSEQQSTIDVSKAPIPRSPDMPPPVKKNEPRSPDMPPPNKKNEPRSPDMPPPNKKNEPRSPDMPPPNKKNEPRSPDMPPPPIKARSPDMPPPPKKSPLMPFTPLGSPDLANSIDANDEAYVPPEHLREDELFEKSIDEQEEEELKKLSNKNRTAPQIQFDNLVKTYYDAAPYSYNKSTPELEVRFGTRGVKPLTKNNYDNVIKKLKSLGFSCYDENGYYSLRVQNEFLDNNTGKFKLSSIRAEINGLSNIQKYCRTNNINEAIKNNAVKFTKKTPVFNNKEMILPVNFDEYNFRVSYQNEESMMPNKGATYFMINNWKNSKKTFRYLNRVSFTHDDYPISVDISITKSSERNKTYYTTEDSDIFSKPETYEMELEVVNSRIGPGTKFKNYTSILQSLRKGIKFVLSGLQGTNYPVSYPEQANVIASYMRLLYKDKYDPKKWVNSSNFIGPNPVTLQRSNIGEIDENSNVPNIRSNCVVTDKADGDRHLLYINEVGKIYLINTSMDVIFTGAKTFNEENFSSLLDGELIHHDKNGNFINLYAAFDIYYLKTTDVRAQPFMPMEKDKKLNNSRHYLLQNLVESLEAVSIEHQKTESGSITDMYKKGAELISPIRIESKTFYQENPKQSIFLACNIILEKVEQQLFEYVTDGLIFTPAFFGVGADKIGEASVLARVTWKYSFKWKPPKYNTIDFLVTTIKGPTGTDLVKTIFEDGTNTQMDVQLNEYKTIQLRCTFIESKHGFINPCQDVIDDKLPEYKSSEDRSDNQGKPVQFYPTEPYDPEAGICNILLRKDDSNVNKMFTDESEVFEDNTIVEFAYDMEREKGWRWVPLRVRYDKTSEMLKTNKNFGNAYNVADDNWKSIHYPITEEMIRSGLNIPNLSVNKDVYYNETSGKFKTQAMKNFHNLYVKKLLIKSVSKRGDTLIDYACGKAGDLPKWISSQLSFVFGIDISKDNLENKLNGACVRFLNSRKENKQMPYALFVNGNSAYNIKNGSAMLNDKAIQITKAVFGVGPSESDKIGRGVARQYGIGTDGFNVSSCQFAMHYFFENPDTLQGFLRNLSECTKLGGYFIGTAYDGQTIFNVLSKTPPGKSVQIVDDGKKIWEIVKSYTSDKFEDNSSSIGYKIEVFQESINQLISEYLINFDYFDRVMNSYGFTVIDADEAKLLGLPKGSGLFSELFLGMMSEIKKNKFKAADFRDAPNMTVFEKNISFLNRYFVYKKIRHVNTEKVQIELGEFEEGENKETAVAVKVAKSEVVRLHPKARKLNKKLLLVPATEAIDVAIPKQKLIIEEDSEEEEVAPPVKQTPAKQKLIIEEDSEEEAAPKKPEKQKLIIEEDSDDE